MNNEKNTNNEKILITEEMIPIAPINGRDFEKLIVTIDGYNAECFIAQRMSSDKIIILFEKDHPKFGKKLITKYFRFKEPGIMNWGYGKKEIKIYYRD